MIRRNNFLLLAGILSFAVALFQAGISFVPAWSAALGAGDALVANPLLLLVAGLAMSLVFATCGIYALSGAGVIRRLPLLRLALILISAVYLYRGFAFVLQLLIVFKVLPSPESVSLTALLTSLVSLVTGLVYLVGLSAGWKQMKARTAPAGDGAGQILTK